MSNKTYICILRSSSGDCDTPSTTDMEVWYAKYQAWQAQFSDNILDAGNKLGTGSVVRQDGVKDGPFVELKEIIGGYMLLSASSLEEAVAVMQESPMIDNPNTSLEIREVCQP